MIELVSTHALLPRRVLVTGGSGLLGQAVLTDLLAHGCDVVCADRVPPALPVPYRLIDVTDYGQVAGIMAGIDAVVHCAAIPRPLYHPAQVVFHTNVNGTFNVYEAAAAHGVQRVVYASSIAVLGYPFFTHPITPDRVPINETAARAPQDAYALSKSIGEDIAAAFAMRAGIDTISVRLPWIQTPDSFRTQIVPLHIHDPHNDAAANLWAYIDSRDAARACRLTLTTTVTGHRAVFVAAADTFMPQPTRDLLAAHYPAAHIDENLSGFDSVIAQQPARDLLGFIPHYTWRAY